MDPSFLVICAVLLGMGLGIVICALVLYVQKAQLRRKNEQNPKLPSTAVQIFDRYPQGAIILDAALNPVYVNDGVESQNLFSAEMLNNPEFLSEMRDVMQTGEPYLRQPDFENAADTLQIQAFRIHTRFVAILVEDVGEMQRVHAMRRDFIANVSHELKTPVAALSLLSEAIGRGADNPVLVRQFAASMETESQRLANLIKDIIHLSQAQTVLGPEDRTPLSLLELVNEQISTHKNFAAQHDVRIVFSNPDVPEDQLMVRGRSSALQIAIANVLANAIRYSKPGSQVGVGLKFNNDKIELAITDQGPGIAPEFQERVFERFFRVDGSRTRGTGGTGLGLSIARNTMITHGGDITLWSRVGVGSTFTLRFLHADTSPAHPTQTKKTGREQTPTSTLAIAAAQKPGASNKKCKKLLKAEQQATQKAEKQAAKSAKMSAKTTKKAAEKATKSANKKSKKKTD